MNGRESPLLISLRPCFAELIFTGLKQVELRRRFSDFVEGRQVFIYVSSPERILRGGFRVEQVLKGSPESIWQEVSSAVGIDRPEFDAYYQGSNIAYALKIAELWEFPTPIRLQTLKNRLGCFSAPQSWRYLKADEESFLGRISPQQCGPLSNSTPLCDDTQQKQSESTWSFDRSRAQFKTMVKVPSRDREASNSLSGRVCSSSI